MDFRHKNKASVYLANKKCHKILNGEPHGLARGY